MEENLILEGLLSMVTELKEKQEAQVTPAGREETLSRLEAIERALSELRRNPAVPEKELQDILTRLAELRKSGQEQRQSFGEVKNYVVATFGCLKEMLETMKRYHRRSQTRTVSSADLQQSNFFGTPEAIPLFGRSDCLCHVPVPECPSG